MLFVSSALIHHDSLGNIAYWAPNLREIWAANIPIVDDDAVATLAMNASQLEKLSVRKTRVTDKGVYHLTKFALNLVELDAASNAGITSKAFKDMRKHAAKRIKKMDLSDTGVRDRWFLDFLSEADALECLHLNDTDITADCALRVFPHARL